MESNFIEAAEAAGVRHIVKISVLDATRDSFVAVARVHAAIEERFAASGIPATILRANWFMDNFLGSADTIANRGEIYGSAGDGRVAFVDSRDTAAVAAEALTEGGHEGQDYTISGHESLTFAEAADRIGDAIGKRVSYVDMPEEDFKGALAGVGMPEGVADIYVQLNREARLGAFAKTTGVIERLTGSKPRSLQNFARDHARAFRGQS